MGKFAKAEVRGGNPRLGNGRGEDAAVVLVGTLVVLG